MPEYTFSCRNHLGETFDTRTLLCRDDEHARECGRSLLALGYPVVICLGGDVVTTLQPEMSEFNAWLRAFMFPAGVVLRVGRLRKEP
ncbi:MULTISPECIES: diacylglycerol kinase catalytic domain-containing protein [Phenylobacterium]|uniref:Uncharacterized protein n=1 Tax=Phenylobacterium koreense TaxID=266125 RepID=A0ABV2EGD0_9CAUL